MHLAQRRRWIWCLALVVVLGGAVLVGRGLKPTCYGAVMAELWGEPCSPYHPPACYEGSNPSSVLDSAPIVSASLGAALSVDVIPAAVELLCFDAIGGDQVVDIEWQTATEFDTWGFIILRGESLGGSLIPVSDFIPHCDEGGMIGGYYTFQDTAVVNDQAYYYRLQEKVSESESVYYPSLNEPPLLAIPGLPTATSTATRTATPSPTPTVTPSATPSPTASATQAAPTSTPRPSTPPDGNTQLPHPLGSTFTPSPTPVQATDSPLATATQPITATPEDDVALVTALTGSSNSMEASPEPTDLSAAYPIPEDADPSLGTGYPSGYMAPTSTPLTGSYPMPPDRRPSQLATMTPGWSYPLPGYGAAGQGAGKSRFWLYCGFGLSALLLFLGLLMMLRPRGHGE